MVLFGVVLLFAFSRGTATAMDDGFHVRRQLFDPPTSTLTSPGAAGLILVLQEGTEIRPSDSDRDGVALGHVPGFREVAERFHVTQLRPICPWRDRGERWESLNRTFVVRFEEYTPQALAAYAALPSVEQVQEDAFGSLAFEPNDAEFDVSYDGIWPSQWNLRAAPGIDMPPAWEYSTGDSSVLVGIVDSGIKYFHLDLGGGDPPGPNDPISDGNIWVNYREVPSNGVDDDGNGYVDDIVGYDFADDDNDPDDDTDGHATFIAGIISALSRNGWVIAGAAGGTGDGAREGARVPGVRVIPCRVDFRQDVFVLASAVAESFVYLGDLRADGWNVVAVNCSFAFWPVSLWETSAMSDALDYLVSQDVLPVAAAMNWNENFPRWPASRSDVLSVGATDSLGVPADFSNYGSWVEVAAPGVDVISTSINTEDPQADNWFAWSSGTSYAAPHVAAIAALLKSYDPSLTSSQLWQLIVDNTTPYTPTKDVGSGIANAGLALAQILDEVVVAHNGPVSFTSPEMEQSVSVRAVSLGGGSIPSNGVELSYRVDGGSWASLGLEVTAPDSFVTTIPAQPNGSTVDYFIRAENDEGQVAWAPPGAPATTYTYRVDDGFEDDMEFPRGWYVGDSHEGNGAPAWEWSDPEGVVDGPTQIQPEDDHSTDGTRCWVTGALAGSGPNAYEVDGGATVLYSPRFDLVGAEEVVVSYWYWYSETQRGAPRPGYEAAWRVDISNDGGGTWTSLDQRSGSSTDGWEHVTVQLDTVFVEPGEVQLRFLVADHQSTYWAEGLVDDFQIEGVFPVSKIESMELPLHAQLLSGSPNPFGLSIEFKFALTKETSAYLSIYDVAGREVRRLLQDRMSAGEHKIIWDGTDDGGRLLGSGTYFCRLRAGDRLSSKRLVLMR